jgi:hypothetical protein
LCKAICYTHKDQKSKGKIFHNKSYFSDLL